MYATVAKKELEEMKELGQFSTVFEDTPTPAPVSTVSNDLGMALGQPVSLRVPHQQHLRSISSDSGTSSSASSSSTMRSMPLTRYHPSLETFRGRPADDGSSSAYAAAPQTLNPSERDDTVHPPTRTLEMGSQRPIKRRRLSFSSDEDEVTPLRDNPTAQERKNYKRQLNTIAARRSRQRKREQLSELKAQVQRLEADRLKYYARSESLLGMLAGFGIPPPIFSEDCD